MENSMMGRRGAILLVAAVLCMAGCGGVSQEARRDELKAVGLSYVNYYTAMQKPALSFDDLLKLNLGLEDETAIITSIKDAGYLFRSVESLDGKAASDVVLCYHPDALTKGGDVLYADASVGPITADELKEAIK